MYIIFSRGKTTNDRAEVDTNYQMWGVSQDILQKIEIPIVSGKTCRKEYGIFRKDTLLCAGAEEGELVLESFKLENLFLSIRIIAQQDM